MATHSVASRAFVTGATGLLGNNLVRLLLADGVAVRALARSPAKAERQFADQRWGTGAGELDVVEGDMTLAALYPLPAEATGAPTRRLPLAARYALGAANEAYARADTVAWCRAHGELPAAAPQSAGTGSAASSPRAASTSAVLRS